jgi:hypothetical protein
MFPKLLDALNALNYLDVPKLRERWERRKYYWTLLVIV